MRKHDCGVALYPPPEVGGFTATEDNTNRLNEAKAFIEKQMVLKKQLGLIA